MMSLEADQTFRSAVLAHQPMATDPGLLGRTPAGVAQPTKVLLARWLAEVLSFPLM